MTRFQVLSLLACALILAVILVTRFDSDLHKKFPDATSYFSSSNPEKPKEEVIENKKYARVLVEDGKVRDCNSGEVRSTGVKVDVKTAEISGVGLDVVEDRNQSMGLFQTVYKLHVWGTNEIGRGSSGIAFQN